MTATISYIGHATNTAGQSTVVASTNSDVANGDALFVAVMIYSSSVTVQSVSDANGNSYVPRVSARKSPVGVFIYDCVASSGLTHNSHVTATLTSTARAAIVAYGLNSGATFSDSGSSTGSSTSPSASTNASVAAGSVVIGSTMASDGNFIVISAPGGIWSDDFDTSVFGAADGSVSAETASGITGGAGIATYNPSLNLSSAWACAIAAYGASAAVNDPGGSSSGSGGLFF